MSVFALGYDIFLNNPSKLEKELICLDYQCDFFGSNPKIQIMLSTLGHFIQHISYYIFPLYLTLIYFFFIFLWVFVSFCLAFLIVFSLTKTMWIAGKKFRNYWKKVEKACIHNHIIYIYVIQISIQLGLCLREQTFYELDRRTLDGYVM